MNYVKIPREIIYNKDLSSKRVIIFSYLCVRRSLDDTVAFSTTELCHRTDIFDKQDEFDKYYQRASMVEMFKKKAEEICPNNDERMNIILDMTYGYKGNRQFCWDCIGELIIKRSLRLVGTEEAKEELSDLGEETDGMITTVSKLRNTIQSATSAATKDGKGFDIFDSNGNYKSTYEIMQGLADLYDEIVKKDKELGTNNLNLLLETIAGKNRSNIAASILQNGDMLRSVYEDAQNSEGSAEKELNSYLDSVDGKFQQLQNRTQEFWYNVIDTTTVKSVLDFTTDLTEGASKFFKLVEKHLPTILGAIATIIASNKSGGLIRLINFINNSPFLATVEFNREVYELIV